MNVEFRDAYLAKYGFLPICGGSKDTDQDDVNTPDDDDAEDEDEDDPSDDDAKDRKKKSPPKDDAKFTQADIDRVLKTKVGREVRKLLPGIREEEAEKLKTASTGKESDIQAELKAANKRIESLEALVLDFNDLAEDRYQTAYADLPEAIKELAPDDDAPAAERERWLFEKALPAVKRLKAKEAKRTKKDEDDDEDEAEKTAPRRSRKGFNPAEPDKGSKPDKKVVDGLLKRYQRDSTYQPM